MRTGLVPEIIRKLDGMQFAVARDMTWTNWGWMIVGALAALAPACSGSVKNSDADGSGNGGDSTASAGTPSGGSTFAVGGVSGGGAGSTSTGSAARSGIGGSGPSITQGGAAGEPLTNFDDTAGSPADDAGAGGVANDACDSANGNGCIIEYGDDIRALVADDSNVYWVTHGTTDSLGNYRNDGRLFKRALGGQTAQVIATGLAGPVGIGLTSTHFFVYLDQAWDAQGQYALARVPITGGDAQTIERGARLVDARGGACVHCFAHSGSTAYFALKRGIFSMNAEAMAMSELTEMQALSLAASGQYLYFEAEDATTSTAQMWRVAVTGSDPERISTQDGSDIQALGYDLYGIVMGGTSYFASMPLAGGVWTHLAKVSPGAVSQLDLADALYFYDSQVYDEPYRVYVGNVGEPTSQTAVLSMPNKASVKAWVGTATGLYWTDGHSVRLRTHLPE